MPGEVPDKSMKSSEKEARKLKKSTEIFTLAVSSRKYEIISEYDNIFISRDLCFVLLLTDVDSDDALKLHIVIDDAECLVKFLCEYLETISFHKKVCFI